MNSSLGASAWQSVARLSYSGLGIWGEEDVGWEVVCRWNQTDVCRPGQEIRDGEKVTAYSFIMCS